MPDVDMAEFWDARAREDAAYFIDNRLDYRAGGLDEFWRRGEQDLDLLLDAVGLTVRADDDVVEIGCGIGRLTRPLARRARQVLALDVSPEMLRLAQEHNRALINVTWVRGDGTSLASIPSGAASAAISHVVFQHIPDPNVTLGYVRELGRVLRPGGWAAFQVSTDPAVHRRRWDRAQWRTRLGALVGRAPRGQQHSAWRGSAVGLEALRRAADDGALDVEHVVGEGTQHCFVLVRRRPA
jgi:SAM-dependent methyltransferase